MRRLELVQVIPCVLDLARFVGYEGLGALHERVDLRAQRGRVLVSPLCDCGLGED